MPQGGSPPFGLITLDLDVGLTLSVWLSINNRGSSWTSHGSWTLTSPGTMSCLALAG